MLSPFDPAVQPGHATPDHRVVIVQGLDPLTVRDGVEGEPVQARDALPGWRLAVGDRALAQRMGSELFVTHALTKRPTRGAVVSVSDQVAVVNAGGQLWDLGFVGAAPAAGAQVRILWDGDGGTILGVVGSATPAPDRPVDQPGAGGQGATINARPIGWATYRGGARDTSEPGVSQGFYPGYGHFGAKSGLWVYGDIWGGVTGRTCTRLQIALTRTSGVGTYAPQPVHAFLHPHTQLPGNPTWVSQEYTGISIAAGSSATFELPAWWGTNIANGSAKGVGISYGGSDHYMRLEGANINGSGTLTAQYA